MTGRLSIHVLDTSLGRPAEGLAYHLSRDGEPLLSGKTGPDGRADGPLLAGDALKPGLYELLFEAGAYLQATGVAVDALFFDRIPIRFRVMDPGQNYHVPLILARYGYSTYRGS